MTVRARRYVDDDAAFFTRSFSSRHAFYGLVNVLVQRIAAVGRDDDVSRNRFYTGQFHFEVDTGIVSFFAVAGKSSDDLLIGVDDDVANECQFSRFSSIEHIFVNRVALQDTRTGIGAGDEFRAVVSQDRIAGNTRQTDLRPPDMPAKKCGSIKLQK